MAVVNAKYGEVAGLGSRYKNGTRFNYPGIHHVHSFIKGIVDPDKTYSIGVPIIEDAFNPVTAGVGGRELQSSLHNFYYFCDENFIQHSINEDGTMVRLRIDLKAACGGK